MNDLIPTASGDMVPEVVFGDEPSDPKERAEHRLRRLATSFAEVLGTIAQMHQDEDWKYVTREDGSPYTSLADLLREHMGVSVAMARRYIQGARDIYLPLQQLVVQGTPIQITAGDVAALGRPGAEEVVSTVAERLTGDETPDEAGQVITDSVGEVKERREQQRRDERDSMSAGSDDDDNDFGFEVPSADGPSISGVDAFSDLSEGDETPAAPQPAAALSVNEELARVMEGATEYTSPEALETLPERLQDIVQALHVLASMDAQEAAGLVSYETRGAILPIDHAQVNMHKFRSRVETSAWFLSRMS